MYNNIALIYGKKGDYSKAVEYLKKLLRSMKGLEIIMEPLNGCSILGLLI
ncbi:MAG: tetratricopeptide repeat protein [Sulfurihydrogenibium azorense]